MKNDLRFLWALCVCWGGGGSCSHYHSCRFEEQIHLYSVGNGDDKKPSKMEVGEDGFVSSVQSVIAFHPSRDVMAGANASGRVHIFR